MGILDMDSITRTGISGNLNRGVGIAGNGVQPPTSPVITVWAEPMAADLPREIHRSCRKVMAPGPFAVTQRILDGDHLFRYLEAVGDFAIAVIAVTWPFACCKNAVFMAK